MYLKQGEGGVYFFLEHVPILVYFSKLALDTTPLSKDLKKYTVYFSIMALAWVPTILTKKLENQWSLLLKSTFWDSFIETC